MGEGSLYLSTIIEEDKIRRLIDTGSCVFLLKLKLTIVSQKKTLVFKK